MKIIPAGLTFEQALRAGYTGRILCRPYLDWLKTLPCDTCGAGAPSDPSHYNGLKGAGTKAADLFAIPQCRKCHDEYELLCNVKVKFSSFAPTAPGGEVVINVNQWDFMHGPFLARVALYHVQAFFEGRLVWAKE